MSIDDEVPFATTLRVRDTCLCLHLQRAARAVARRFDAALRPLGLTSGQFSLLMALNRPEPASLGAVSAVLAMDRTTVTANLKPLQRRGMVGASVGERDRRTRYFVLTPPGRAMLASALPVWQRTHAALDTCLDGASEELRAGLRALSGNAGEVLPPQPSAAASSLGSR
ncbi:MAG TPA: MarR family winged helix-turn-helix transcriptional regulator [Stellaceae bacterium]|nr:MarR family winged helix-turn-helix transcriptional regulator [Stellaceae bacterium]